MNPFTDDNEEEEEEEEYICRNCGEDWDGESTAFYVEGRCSNCKAPGGTNKVKKSRMNSLTREGEKNE